jgi:hypothetical protein
MSIKHGMRKTRLYNIWIGMRQRCNDPKSIGYSNYGGRGIKVCREWQKDFKTFSVWALSNGYSEHLCIDRINNDGGYSPDNCRWVTNKANCNNTSVNHYIKINGVTKTLMEWSEYLAVPRSTMSSRVSRGWKPRDLLRPVTKR